MTRGFARAAHATMSSRWRSHRAVPMRPTRKWPHKSGPSSFPHHEGPQARPTSIPPDHSPQLLSSSHQRPTPCQFHGLRPLPFSPALSARPRPSSFPSCCIPSPHDRNCPWAYQTSFRASRHWHPCRAMVRLRAIIESMSIVCDATSRKRDLKGGPSCGILSPSANTTEAPANPSPCH